MAIEAIAKTHGITLARQHRSFVVQTQNSAKANIRPKTENRT